MLGICLGYVGSMSGVCREICREYVGNMSGVCREYVKSQVCVFLCKPIQNPAKNMTTNPC